MDIKMAYEIYSFVEISKYKNSAIHDSEQHQIIWANWLFIALLKHKIP